MGGTRATAPVTPSKWQPQDLAIVNCPSLINSLLTRSAGLGRTPGWWATIYLSWRNPPPEPPSPTPMLNGTCPTPSPNIMGVPGSGGVGQDLFTHIPWMVMVMAGAGHPREQFDALFAGCHGAQCPSCSRTVPSSLKLWVPSHAAGSRGCCRAYVGVAAPMGPACPSESPPCPQKMPSWGCMAAKPSGKCLQGGKYVSQHQTTAKGRGVAASSPPLSKRQLRKKKPTPLFTHFLQKALK